MTEEPDGFVSRRARKEAETGTGKSKGKKIGRRGFKAVLFTILLPFLLLGWVVPKTFLDLCGSDCSYSEMNPIAGVVMWVFLGLSILCILSILFFAIESITHQEKKTKAITSTIIAGLLSGFFFFGEFQEILESVVIKVMY